MKIELKRIPIREVVEGYVNNQEDGVVGYGGRLNIRPKYQREFVYDDKQRNLVMDTISKNLPLNVMYWVKNDDGTFEVMDGQQRTISFAAYVNGEYSIFFQFFHNLTQEEQDAILDYELMIYICEGTDKQKLEWFRIINIAGEKLTNQELRNAVYTGPWLTDAKRHFAKTGCPAYQIGQNYMRGSTIRQDYLETAIRWIAKRDKKGIEDYMAENQHNKDANELWSYFQQVINWVNVTFPNYRKEMKGIDWGYLYNDHRNDVFNSSDLEDETKRLMMDDDVTKKAGIYPYLITGKEAYLNIRSFSPAMRRAAFERQNGICPMCDQEFAIKDMEADHITPWSRGGKTNTDNCQMLCREDNRRKSNV